MFPTVSLHWAIAGGPLGTMPLGEKTIIDGTGSQTAGRNRWGDYTSLTVDPTDDLTFWHVNEWVPDDERRLVAVAHRQLQVATGAWSEPWSRVATDSRREPGLRHEMPLTGASGVEDRSARSYSAVFTFDAPATSGQVTVFSGTATVGAITFNGNGVTAQLTGVTSAEIVTLHTQNINGDGQPHGDSVWFPHG